MKIGIDIRTLMDAQYSGVSEYTLNLVKEILKLDTSAGSVKAKNEYRLFYNSARDLSKRIPVFNFPNVEIIKYNYPNKIFNYLMQKALSWPKVDKLLGGVDVFWSPHINFIALSIKCQSVLTIHDLSFLRYPEFFSLRKNFWHYALNIKKLLKKSDKIVAVSENTKNDIIELCNVDKAKIEVIYSGIGEQYKKISLADKECEEVKRKYGLPEKFILYLGTLEPRKNVIGLIQAYNELRRKNKAFSNIKLVIAGGEGWKSKKIFRERENSEFKNDIKFLGYVEGEDKPYLYNLAQLFVYPSFYEGFGFPPLEAMACGTPVVASFTSSLGEVVGHAALMVDPYNINAIAEAMKQVIIDERLREDLIKKGLSRASQFSWPNTAKKYLSILDNE